MFAANREHEEFGSMEENVRRESEQKIRVLRWMDDLILRNLTDGSLFSRQTGVAFTSITGIAHFSFDHRKLLPRDANDLRLAP